ncbi:MAG: hypothetical protein K2N63_05230 [Lachnospiraceae bacterium]|nr:hypothetical protein [Lachnospiraceae bacterium]
MQKMLCPFCDHEIKGKGKCDFCGSWVRKPVVAQMSAELNTQASVSSTVQAVQGGGTGSVAGAAEAGNQMGVGQQTGNQMGAGQRTGAPRRAVLASEAVERGQTTVKTGGSKTVVKVIVTVIVVNIILQFLLMIFNLL